MQPSNKEYNVVETFSGIGSQATALKNIGVKAKILNTCEWNLHAIVAYALIHDISIEDKKFDGSKEQLVEYLYSLGISNDGKKSVNKSALQCIEEGALNKLYAAITETNNLVDISKVSGSDLDSDIDILTYSFPCQDLSNVGAFHGYKQGIDRGAGNRSGLLWEIERILFERKKEDMYLPHFLLMENVPALNSPRHKGNFKVWKDQLNELGYYNKQYVLNAKDFGLPQNRERLIMLSILTYNDKDIENELDFYFEHHNLEDNLYRETLGISNTKLCDYLKTNYSNEVYKKEALSCQPNNTESRRKIWDENPQLTDDCGNIKDMVVSTLTTKQDRHPNSGNLRVNFDNNKANFRYLTPRECFILMGFSEEDYDKVISNNFHTKKNAKMFTRDNLIKMAGNSIAVNVLEAVFRQVVELDNRLYI